MNLPRGQYVIYDFTFLWYLFIHNANISLFILIKSISQNNETNHLINLYVLHWWVWSEWMNSALNWYKWKSRSIRSELLAATNVIVYVASCVCTKCRFNIRIVVSECQTVLPSKLPSLVEFMHFDVVDFFILYNLSFYCWYYCYYCCFVSSTFSFYIFDFLVDVMWPSGNTIFNAEFIQLWLQLWWWL